MIIRVKNVVWSEVDMQHVSLLMPCLTYKDIKWVYDYKTRRKVREYRNVSLINPQGRFNTGLLPRVKRYLDEHGVKYTIRDSAEKIRAEYEPQLPVIPGVFQDFHPHQIELINAATTAGRGCIVAATGTGKTACAAGIITCYDDLKWLFVVHTKTLARQAQEAFAKYQFDNISTCYEGHRDTSGDIVIATRQTLANMDLYREHFDGVIVDECHHTPDAYAQNLCILNQLTSPLRFGLTASYPSDLQQQLSIEAAIGPIVGEFTAQEAIECGVIAKPLIKMHKTAFHENIRLLHRWRDVEYRGIVTNYARNKQIIDVVQQYVTEGKSVLILINQIEHGKLLQEIALHRKLAAYFIHGETETQVRERMRGMLNDKTVQCIIASTIWKEGVDIPTLDVVVNAGGGKSEIGVLQKIGRGFRKTQDKDTFVFVDFFDPSHHLLIKHFGERMSLYFEMRWL